MSLIEASLTYYDSNNPYVEHNINGDIEVLMPIAGVEAAAHAWEEDHSPLNQLEETAEDREKFQRWLKGAGTCIALAKNKSTARADSSGFGEITGEHPVNM